MTRPQALQETFDQCADVIVQKLQSYYQQADEYHNQCLQGERYLALILQFLRYVSIVKLLVIPIVRRTKKKLVIRVKVVSLSRGNKVV